MNINTNIANPIFDLVVKYIIVDANVVMSALISSLGKTAELIFSDKLKLYAPEFLLEEVNKHRGEISDKSGLSSEEINSIPSSFILECLFDFDAKKIHIDEKKLSFQ